ncbi:hypothetical protein [Agrobacterium larrymoorei]|uniref:Uncharacterized protein n=1 Tax=Agrobacterium larrymoorei TaxID=160699 RepID=A0AAF0HFS1_9HYPH|nr:hypothetical protein [Agrobacterium larrymoorei]WHA44060.1 hypothetical protein CFBP5477_021835 [Agrobacterium larrymoorei]
MKDGNNILNVPLPAHVAISRGHGSCLFLDYQQKGGRPSVMIDRCRWVILAQGNLVFYDYDLSDLSDIAVLAPYLLTSIRRYSDHIVLNFGQHQLMLFWTRQSQEYFYPGVARSGIGWTKLPQDERDNLTIFPLTGEALGVEFNSMLEPREYIWGEKFLEREAELSASESRD